MKKANKSQTKKKEDLLLERAKQRFGQHLITGATLVIVALMFANTVGLVQAVNSGTSNLNLSISAGVLEIFVNGTSVQFPSGTAGAASNVFQNMDELFVRDFRSTSNYDWDMNAFSDPLNGVTDTNYVIPNTSVALFSNNAVKTNIETYTTANVGNGVGERALNGDNIYFNSENGGTGVIKFNDALFKVNLNASLSPQDYRGDVTLTVIAS